MKFTFKKQLRIDRPYSIADIKLNKKRIGLITPPLFLRISGSNSWRIRIAVKENRNWKRVAFKVGFDTEEKARAWVKEHLEPAIEKNKFELHFFEEDV